VDILGRHHPRAIATAHGLLRRLREVTVAVRDAGLPIRPYPSRHCPSHDILALSSLVAP
jgi:hypothetical protein